MTVSDIAAGGITWQVLDRAGAGIPLLLLHGNRDRKELWRPLLDELAGQRALAVDLPGHGGTSLPAGADMDHHVRALGELLDAMSIGQVIVVGHSLGGQLSIALAAERPDLVAALVVIGSALEHRSSFKPRAAADNDDMIARVGRIFFPPVGQEPDTRDKLRAEVFGCWKDIPWEHHLKLNALARVDAVAAAAKVSAPCLVLTGEHDLICPPDRDGTAIAAAIDGARHQVIGDAGHFAHLEYPALAAAAIREFLATRALAAALGGTS